LTITVLVDIIHLDYIRGVNILWMKINLRSSLPAYQQIILGIKESILKNELKEDDTAPSIRELAQMINVNPNTVARAYRELEGEGIFVARQGVGYIVVRGKEEIIRGFVSQLENQLVEPLTKLKNSGVELNYISDMLKDLWGKI